MFRAQRRLMTEQVHEHGALAGAELWAGGARSTSLFTREATIDVATLPNSIGMPHQSRAMTRASRVPPSLSTRVIGWR